MAFNRVHSPAESPSPELLTCQMAGIGMNFAATNECEANIEDVLIFASEVGMIEGDLRVLGVLAQWIEVHGASINAQPTGSRALFRNRGPRGFTRSGRPWAPGLARTGVSND